MDIKDGLKRVLRLAENLLFLPHCVFCNCALEINTMGDVCGKCVPITLFCNERTCCERCGKPIVGFGEKQLCYFCLENRSKYFKRIISVFEYRDVVRESILRYKLARIKCYAKTYAKLMAARFYEEYDGIEFDMICGAPSHKRNGKNMDFDHTDELCLRLSEIISVPYISGVLEKTEKTKRQSELGYDERRKNLTGKISVTEKARVDGERILLVDDICTTRSTIMECARALSAAGAKEVYALTLATTSGRD